STWRGFDDLGSALPAISVLGLADLVGVWLDGVGWPQLVMCVAASLGGMVGVASAVRHAARCARLVTISAGLRPDGWGTATRHVKGGSCATAFGPATATPAWGRRARPGSRP